MITPEIFKSNGILNKNRLRESWVKSNITREYDNIISFSQNNNQLDLKFSQVIYNYLNNISEIPTCEFCQTNRKRFIGFNEGYNNFCSKSCASKSSKPREIENRKKNTMAKFGVEHTSQLESVKAKQKETNIKKWGYHSPTLNDSVRRKQRDTMLSKWGVEYSGMSDILLNKSLETRRVKYEKSVLETYTNINIISIVKEGNFDIKCDICGEIYNINNSLLRLRYFRYRVIPCLYCNPIKSYSGQTEIYEFLDLNGIDYIRGDRSILGGKEIDIFIPNKNVAIEFNGIYWHSSLFKDREYHLNKKIECEKKGIRLIHIWEDEWIYKRPIVESMILSALHINRCRIMARNCQVIEVSSGEESKFMENNHLQGKVNSSKRLALFHEGEIVSMMTFGKYRRSNGSKHKIGEWELYRFCNKLNLHVIGGFSKLLSHFIKEMDPNRIVTYTKRDWSSYLVDGRSVYSKYFLYDGETKPGYYYFDSKLMRSHRFKYTKSKLDTELNESEKMENDGYLRVYDTGNFRFVWNKVI